MYRVTVGWWEPRPDTLLGWTSGRQCLRNKKDYKLIKPILNSRCDTNFTKTQRICHNPAQTRTNGPGYVMLYKFSRWPSPLKVQGPNPALAVAVLRAYIPDSRTYEPPRSHRPPVNLCFSLQQLSRTGERGFFQSPEISTPPFLSTEILMCNGRSFLPAPSAESSI